jgi:hypothetical protein
LPSHVAGSHSRTRTRRTRRGELLVYDRAEKKTSNADPYVVQAIGDVTVWARGGAGNKPLSRTGRARILPDEIFRAEEFLPVIDGDSSRLWEWIDKVRGEVESRRRPAASRVRNDEHRASKRKDDSRERGSRRGRRAAPWHRQSGVVRDRQLMELQHMILSHHGALEYGSPVLPMTTKRKSCIGPMKRPRGRLTCSTC